MDCSCLSSKTTLKKAYLANKYNKDVGIDNWISNLKVIELGAFTVIQRYFAAKTLFDASKVKGVEDKAEWILKMTRGPSTKGEIYWLWSHARIRNLINCPNEKSLKVIYLLFSGNLINTMNSKLYVLPTELIRKLIELFMGKEWMF